MGELTDVFFVGTCDRKGQVDEYISDYVSLTRSNSDGALGVSMKARDPLFMLMVFAPLSRKTTPMT